MTSPAYTELEDAFLRKHYKTMSYDELSKRIAGVNGNKRIIASVKNRMYVLRCRKNPRPNSVWSDDEAGFLWDNQHETNPKIMILFNAKFEQNRTLSAIIHKLFRLRDASDVKVAPAPAPDPVAKDQISIKRKKALRKRDGLPGRAKL